MQIRSLQQYSSDLKQSGFTILELMVAVALVAILVAIAVPSYNAAMAKSDRSIAIADIDEISLVQGRFFSANRRYTADFKDLNMAGTSTTTISDTDGFYNYTIAIQNSGANYTVIGTPQNSRDTWDLMLDDKNVKSRKGVSDSTWARGWP